jgi:hypothetical protein
MNSYLKIFIVAFILLGFSMINENRNIEYLNTYPNQYNYINIFIIRYVHYLIFLFITFYLFFFNGIGNTFDVYLFLFLILFIVFGWYVCECCWFSYLELLFYNRELIKDICTTFHACFHSILIDDTIITICGILMLINVTYVLFYFDKLNIKYRILYFIVFLSLFIHSIIEGRLNKKYYDPEKNNILNGIKKMFISVIV